MEMGQALGKSAYLIDGVNEIQPEWLAGINSVLITAGASAPEQVVQEVIEMLQVQFGATLDEVVTREEHVTFPLPKELRQLSATTG